MPEHPGRFAPGYKTSHNVGGGGGGKSKSKDRMPTATRVTSAHEGFTPIAGAPQPKNVKNVAPRVVKSPGFPRKNDPKMMKMASMGLKIGTRVTSSRAKTSRSA